jgi:NADPH:quinone reductase-like Zn-dependent oxidoreductase
MKAIVRDRYGPPDILRSEEIEKPVPREGEVLIRVRAASVNPADWHVLRGDPFLIRLGEGLGKPKQRILGIDIAGVVEAVGRDVHELEPGDEVFGTSKTGAFAEYVCVPRPRREFLAPHASRRRRRSLRSVAIHDGGVGVSGVRARVCQSTHWMHHR